MATTTTVIPGQPAPALDLPTLTGGRIESTSWDGHPVLVSFLRHAG
jgi:peroxiredoxin